MENSFSSEEESSEEDEMDEGMRMAIEMSKKQEKVDNQKRNSTKGGPDKSMMGETDGFNFAIK
jgi:hypothetical protein